MAALTGRGIARENFGKSSAKLHIQIQPGGGIQPARLETGEVVSIGRTRKGRGSAQGTRGIREELW